MSAPRKGDAGAPGGGDGSVTLVGTAHVSSESADRVREAIAAEDPDIVAVELDEARYQQFRGETPDDIDPTDLLSGSTVFQFLAYWMLSYAQSRLGSRFGVEPGADMRAAIEAAEDGGYGLALVDRDIQTTVQRFWSRLTIMEKLKLIGGLAIGAADPLAIGLTIGISIGVILGVLGGLVAAPLLGYAGLFTLGLGGTTVSAVVGGTVVGGIGGAIIGAVLVPPSGTSVLQRTVGGLILGVGAGGYLALSGMPLPLIGTIEFMTTGERIIRAATGGSLGLVLGGLLGGFLGVVFRAGQSDTEQLTEADIEALTDTDVVTAMMEEFRQFSPGGAEALIDERDAYIAHNLIELREQGYDVVAVIGAGHREGIERYLTAPETLPSRDAITGVASGRRFSLPKLLGYAVTVAFLGFFFLLAMAGVRNILLLKLFVAWFLFNGVFAFIGARLAGGTLSSAAVGGAVAWLTSINPLLAPGWFAGYMELRRRPVNIGDISRLNELLDDTQRPIRDILADMYQVPLFRLLAVVGMTNIGSIIATFLFPVVVLPFFFDGVTGVAEVGELMIEGATNSAERIGELFR